MSVAWLHISCMVTWLHISGIWGACEVAGWEAVTSLSCSALPARLPGCPDGTTKEGAVPARGLGWIELGRGSL